MPETHEEEEHIGGEPPEFQEGKAPRSRLLRWGLLVLLVVAAGGLYYWFSTRNEVSTDDAQVDGHIVPVTPTVAGRVIRVLVDDNQHVTAGQVVVQLDPRDYQARVDEAKAALGVAQARAHAAQVGVPLTEATTTSGTSQAQAELAAAQAQAQQAQTTARQAATADVATAQANLAQAEANNQKAQADVNRMRPLVAKDEISQQQFDFYVAAARSAAAQVEAAREQLNASRQRATGEASAAQAAVAKVQQARSALQAARANQQQVNVSAAQAQSAQAAIGQAQANLAAAELNLWYTDIRADVAGVVTNKTVEPGQAVAPGQALMSVVPLHDVWVTANFKETQLAHVRPGDRAEVKVDMYGRKIPGVVNSIAGATGARTSLLPPENASGNFVKVVERIPVKIVFPNGLPSGIVLRPGMNVDATIYTK